MKPRKAGLRKSTAPAGLSRSGRNARRAIFLDRDGTICDEVGYLNHLRRFALFRNAPSAIRLLNEKEIPVIVVTNQSGVSRGFFPETLVKEVHEKLHRSLRHRGAHVDGVYYCPHQKKDGCKCRKPSPGMMRQAAREHHLKLKGSWLVSDRYADIQMAHAVGGYGALVMTGYGRGEYVWNRQKWPRQPDLVAEDLAEAVAIILRRWK